MTSATFSSTKNLPHFHLISSPMKNNSQTKLTSNSKSMTFDLNPWPLKNNYQQNTSLSSVISTVKFDLWPHSSSNFFPSKRFVFSVSIDTWESVLAKTENILTIILSGSLTFSLGFQIRVRMIINNLRRWVARARPAPFPLIYEPQRPPCHNRGSAGAARSVGECVGGSSRGAHEEWGSIPLVCDYSSLPRQSVSLRLCRMQDPRQVPVSLRVMSVNDRDLAPKWILINGNDPRHGAYEMEHHKTAAKPSHRRPTYQTRADLQGARLANFSLRYLTPFWRQFSFKVPRNKNQWNDFVPADYLLIWVWFALLKGLEMTPIGRRKL